MLQFLASLPTLLPVALTIPTVHLALSRWIAFIIIVFFFFLAKVFFFIFNVSRRFLINLFIFGCVGSLFLCEGFL